MRALQALAAWPVGAAAAGVLARPGPVAAPAPPGSRPQEVGTQGPVDRAFPWASVTKLCTALAVLVAWEERTLALDDPVGPPGATVAHLLAHASGLGPEGPAVLAPPGHRRIYSNAGFELLGRHLSARAGMPFPRYLAEAVLEPLGMAGARFGHDASPAHGMTGTLEDLLALGRELMSPVLVSAETLDRATTVAFPGLAGVLPGFGRQVPCDWGLGFEIRGAKDPHWTGTHNSPATFGHFGRSGCFLWVDPEAGAACAVLGDTEFGPWAARDWPALSDAVLEELGLPGVPPDPAP